MTYKITIPLTKGAAYAHYEQGVLKYFLMSDLDAASATLLTAMPYVATTELELKRQTGILISELKPRTVPEKIAAFMIAYQQHKGVAYRPTKEERANLANVTVNAQLLNTYFTATQYPLAGLKSITDYIRHYNEVRDLAKNGIRPRNEFPDVYDREFEKRISDDVSKLQRYWDHLRTLGWRKADGVWVNEKR